MGSLCFHGRIKELLISLVTNPTASSFDVQFGYLGNHHYIFFFINFRQTNLHCVYKLQINNKWKIIKCNVFPFCSRLLSQKPKEFLFQLPSLIQSFLPTAPCLPTIKAILLPGRIFSVRHCPLYDWQAHYPISITILPNQSIHCVLLKAEKGNLLHENDQASAGRIPRRDEGSGWVLGFNLWLSKVVAFTGELIDINVKMSSV